MELVVHIAHSACTSKRRRDGASSEVDQPLLSPAAYNPTSPTPSRTLPMARGNPYFSSAQTGISSKPGRTLPPSPSVSEDAKALLRRRHQHNRHSCPFFRRTPLLKNAPTRAKLLCVATNPPTRKNDASADMLASGVVSFTMDQPSFPPEWGWGFHACKKFASALLAFVQCSTWVIASEHVR